ncbi:MAG: single-stranded-DNA-specific exonuclease RecJ, partial [Thermoanaerobacteraceae bacterium]|nr:single-stranded-DNA-specific exonuclease RecJ [Thermoanaerobacteraceae bacterium]
MQVEIIIKPDRRKKCEHLIKRGIDPLIAELLYNRGINSYKEAKLFLEGSFDDMHDPGKIRNINKAFELINEAINLEKKIYIFGDYDVDGITATAIMYNTLMDLGAEIHYRLPNRLTEGYGITVGAIKELHENGCDLIIAVDNGIRCHKEIALAKELGMEVIIIDHHAPADTLPEADAIIDFYVDGETYPYIELAGCGVAFKVSCYLYEQFGFGIEEGYKNIDIAAIGTIADVVPLTGENRIIVKEGLKYINDPAYDRIGIISLMNVFEIESGTLTSMDIGFKIAPALNAPGRLLDEGAGDALELLLCEDEVEAINIAMDLKAVNDERKSITQECLIKAEEYIEANNLLEDKVLVLFVPEIPEGVVGLVSGKITEKYNRPSIVFSEGLDYYKASGRSIEAFNLYQALCACDDVFVKYGGHAQAAGMSIVKDKKKIEELRTRINKYADKVLDDKDLIKKIYVDKELEAEDIGFELVDKISVLEPFGQENPKPIFHVKGFRTVIKNKNGEWLPHLYMGEHGNHLKLYGDNADAIGFDMVEKYEAVGKPRKLDITFTFGINNFMGRD